MVKLELFLRNNKLTPIENVKRKNIILKIFLSLGFIFLNKQGIVPNNNPEKIKDVSI